MNLKKDNALAGVDIVISVIVIIIFSGLILTLIQNNAMENLKLSKETMAMIYATEIFENIGIAKYDDVIEVKANDFIPKEALDNYTVDIKIDENLEEIQEGQELIKKISLTLKYNIGNKEYDCYMERLKVRE